MSLDLLRAIDELPTPEVLVVGDLILDRYIGGPVERISPEAPVQVLKEDGVREGCGGMAAVAANLARLGAHVRAIGLVGGDIEGEQLRDHLGGAGVDCGGIVVDPARQTTVKTRLVAYSHRSHQQILRIDRETVAEPDPPVAEELLAKIRAALPAVDMLVLSDYGKGVLSGALCVEIITAARAAGVKTIVDPKGRDYTRYRGATAITPNRTEAAVATGRDQILRRDDAAAAAQELIEGLDLEVVFITLDRDGIFVREKEASGSAIHTRPRDVFDVTGAGDNVISVLACAMAGGVGPLRAAALANVAGGIAVEQFGVVSVGWDEIATRIAAGSGGDAKLLDLDMLKRLIESARTAGRRIVFTNGCFDILHPGHVDLLRQARAQGDLLVVGLNDDDSIRRLKGETRPVNDLRARASVLGGLASVDYIVAFAEDTPEKLIRAVKPDVLVKGADWKGTVVAGQEFVERCGGRMVHVDLLEGHSTTNTIERMKDG
ncbi:MAG: D-glycero-beta-D-manno-heptose 1-phosphate adenylyltransferase [Planctomycetota bacterium]|jgi:D-beta-D-heptose 7-phosphate kinase/D-beta-D-heptose 1-phosphate adenosyltransferase